MSGGRGVSKYIEIINDFFHVVRTVVGVLFLLVKLIILTDGYPPKMLKIP